MDDFKVRYCKLCLANIQGENYKVIGNVTKDVLTVLSLNLDYGDGRENIICNVCLPRLSAALKFKSTCLDTDDLIIPYVNEAPSLPVDLREIYMKEIENKYVSDYVKICRLCMQLEENISEFITVDDKQVDMIHKFIPEMNIFTIKEPVICKLCLESLEMHCNFLKKCSDLGQNIENMSNGQFPDASSSVQLLDICKIEDVDIKFEDIRECMDVNCNELNKSELHNQDIGSQSNLQHHIYTRDKGHLKQHMLEHKNPSGVQVYKCKNCDYETMGKQHLSSHMLMHKSHTELQKYRCQACNYETKFKGGFKRHMLIHKYYTEDQMYKCANCDYEAKIKRNLQKHMLVHKETSKHKCEICGYGTSNKEHFKNHTLKHKDPSEVQMYKCTYCTHETKIKSYLNRHMLIHKSIYKCEDCGYETNKKGRLTKHVLTHKDPSDLQTYKYKTEHVNTQ